MFFISKNSFWKHQFSPLLKHAVFVNTLKMFLQQKEIFLALLQNTHFFSMKKGIVKKKFLQNVKLEFVTNLMNIFDKWYYIIEIILLVNVFFVEMQVIYRWRNFQINCLRSTSFLQLSVPSNTNTILQKRDSVFAFRFCVTYCKLYSVTYSRKGCKSRTPMILCNEKCG